MKRYRMMGFGLLAAAGLQQCQPACTPEPTGPVETTTTVAVPPPIGTTTTLPIETTTTTAAPTTTTVPDVPAVFGYRDATNEACTELIVTNIGTGDLLYAPTAAGDQPFTTLAPSQSVTQNFVNAAEYELRFGENGTYNGVAVQQGRRLTFGGGAKSTYAITNPNCATWVLNWDPVTVPDMYRVSCSLIGDEPADRKRTFCSAPPLRTTPTTSSRAAPRADRRSVRPSRGPKPFHRDPAGPAYSRDGSANSLVGSAAWPEGRQRHADPGSPGLGPRRLAPRCSPRRTPGKRCSTRASVRRRCTQQPDLSPEERKSPSFGRLLRWRAARVEVYGSDRLISVSEPPLAPASAPDDAADARAPDVRLLLAPVP